MLDFRIHTALSTLSGGYIGTTRNASNTFPSMILLSAISVDQVFILKKGH